jgi:LytS/YehU family sensor histidine kinase
MIAPVIFLFILMISLIIYLTKTTEYQAKYYHSQLLPHALLNDMVFFQKSIIENNTANAQQYFAYQTNYLKKILETENKLVSLLFEEIQQTKEFVYYYNLVNNSDFKIQFDVDNKKNKAFYVPSLLFQPFVENIFKYEKNREATILITIMVLESWNNSCLNISIAPNASSNFDKHFKIKKSHRGLNIAKQKIKYTCSLARTDRYHFNSIKIKMNSEGSMKVMLVIPSTLSKI